MGCMKCGEKLGRSETFCDECLEKMEKCPVKPGIAINLTPRPVQATTKKRTPHRRYWLNTEDQVDALRSKNRWLSFALIVAILGFLASVAVIFMLLHQQGRVDLPFARYFGM